MVNSVTPMPTPPMASARMARPRLRDVKGAAVDVVVALLICLLPGWTADGNTHATAVGLLDRQSAGPEHVNGTRRKSIPGGPDSPGTGAGVPIVPHRLDR
ncbi:hypothetical protein NtRootA9_15140 [Arthrobacter sp. NtRootA9]|nr:hypothetical protein NtRootA9_15140 [Arthrobacter sp. NtRootA9]